MKNILLNCRKKMRWPAWALVLLNALALACLASGPAMAEDEVVGPDWYDELVQENATQATALSKAAKIAKDRVTVYQNVDGWTIRVPQGESCSESAIDLATAMTNDEGFQALTVGWEVHNVSGPVGLLSHSTTVLVPPKPAGWQPGDPFRAYVVDNYTGTVGVEPVIGKWDAENQQTYYTFPPRPYGVNPPTSLVRTFFNINTGGAEGTKLTQLGAITTYSGTYSGKSGLSIKNTGYDLETGTFTWEELGGEQPLALQLKQHADSAPTQKAELSVSVAQSIDPNAITGPEGFGDARWVNATTPFTYTIFFENKAEATAPAQTVVVTDTLDTEMFDLDTFQFGEVTTVDRNLPSNALPSKYYIGYIDLRPDQKMVVKVEAHLDEQGVVIWTFSSLDPSTCDQDNCYESCGHPQCMLPLDPADPAGFLPPGAEGSVSFTVMAWPALADGTVIHNSAMIIFDANDPIDTNIWTNTIDTTPPESLVASLPETIRSRQIPITWSGTDTGSGIATFDVLVSENGGPFQPWISNTVVTTATFTDGAFGSTYDFLCTAADKVGNSQNVPGALAVTTTLMPSGDIDNDSDVDRNDLAMLIANRNKPVAQSTCGPAGDMDWDGKITVLDARILATLFSQPGGAIN
ncbi:MAG TPA: dockerin type I domain-containing protein [Thermodesulfobacteriota bacterium]|nr:dockerin type I domain-containing protein [Thermodesulfobacteriota bacterium]